MILHNVEQGTNEWLKVRLGIPTASEFSKIITPTGKLSAQADKYANRLVAEKMLGYPVDEFKGNYHTNRGKELEPEAVSFYELQRDIETVKVGFLTNDEGTIGASPDRLVGEDGLLEIKCPAPQTHIEYLTTGEVDKDYYPQIQGQLLVSGRKWVDILSYHPELPPAIIRVERDEKYIAGLSDALAQFTNNLAAKLDQIKQKNAPKVKHDSDGVIIEQMPELLKCATV
jgi:putative phage-type endonuclease